MLVYYSYMNTQPTPKIIGAFVIGFALVAGAYVTSNFGKPSGVYDNTQLASQTQQAAPIRTAIDVTDEDDNGIEDWRDEFITTHPIIIKEAEDSSEPYEAPDTITGQMGINFIQDIIRSRNFGGYGGDDAAVIENTIRTLEQQTSKEIYDTPDIKIIGDWSEASVHTYANAVATAVLENSKSDLDTELLILQDILNRGDESRMEDLETLAELYRLTRDAIIEIPVPALLVKEHLDLINTLHAVHHDILGMTYTFDDPAYSLLRLKRYEDDIFGMIISFENMYVAFAPYASLFTTTDPAVFFVDFSPSNNIRI